MKDPKNLGSLTLREMLESALGNSQDAERILSSIQKAVDGGAKGDALKELIYKELCNSSVTDINVYHLLLLLPPLPVIPKY